MTQKALRNQFREELRASNFSYIARAVSDLDESETIRCAVLVRKEGPARMVILDLRYKSGCQKAQSSFALSGIPVKQELQAINGDFYDLDYLTVNSPIFYLALWILRLSGLAIFFLLALFFESRRKQTQILLEAERKIAQAKIDIARQVAHDIRSPISAMRMVLPLLVDSTEKIEILRAAANRVDEIAGDLLSRQGSGFPGAGYGGEATDVIKLAREILMEKSMVHGDGGIRLLGDFDAVAVVRIFVPEKELKRMLSNLLNNSIESIDREAGEVRLIIRDFEDCVQIGVADNGKGMSEEILARLGEKGFSHGKSDQKKAGSGLGLFHAKELVQSHHGKIDISSRLGIGTAIMISFPKGSKPA